MKLSAKSRYAIMAVADLALEEAKAPVAISDIAKRQKISGAYLEQLLMRLRRHGLVTSMRGPGGGYRLARSPSDIRVTDILNAVDETILAMGCDAESPTGCTGLEGKCLAHHFLAALDSHIHAFLDQFTLDQLLQQRVLSQHGVSNRNSPFQLADM